MHGCAVASKLKSQQPLACAAIVRCSEAPLPGGFAGQAVEISAWTGVVQAFVHYAAGVINSHSDANLHVPVDRGACAGRHGGNFLVDHSRAASRRPSRQRLRARRR